MATVRRPIPVALHNIAMGKRGPPVTFEQPPKLQVRPTKKSQALAKRVAAVARLNEDTLARLKAASDSLAPVLATKVDVTMPFPRVSSPCARDQLAQSSKTEKGAVSCIDKNSHSVVEDVEDLTSDADVLIHGGARRTHHLSCSQVCPGFHEDSRRRQEVTSGSFPGP